MENNKTVNLKLERRKAGLKGAKVGAGLGALLATQPTLMMLGNAGQVKYYPALFTLFAITTVGGAIMNCKDELRLFDEMNIEENKVLKKYEITQVYTKKKERI